MQITKINFFLIPNLKGTWHCKLCDMTGTPLWPIALLVSRTRINKGNLSDYVQWITDIWIHSKSFYNVVFLTYLGSNAAEKLV